MEKTAVKRKKAAVADLCVACGCCVKVCPLQAITIWKGVKARVDESRCVGCGRCARECPASVISLKEVQA